MGEPPRPPDPDAFPPLPTTTTTTAKLKVYVIKISGVDQAKQLSSITLKTSIELHLGHSIPVSSGRSEANGKSFAIQVRGEADKNKLLSMKQLCDGTKIECSIHPTANKIRGVVNSRDLITASEQEIADLLKAHNVIEVYKITRRVGDIKVSTASVILTFEGTTLPDMVPFGFTILRPRPYYPSPLLCYKCFNFGHTKARCPSQEAKCYNCAQKAHADETTCANAKFCDRCNSNEHAIGSRKCPTYVKENEIQHIKVDKNVPYMEAKRQWEATHKPKGNSYADVLGPNPNNANLTSVLELLKRSEQEKQKLMTQINNMENATTPSPANNETTMEKILTQLVAMTKAHNETQDKLETMERKHQEERKQLTDLINDLNNREKQKDAEMLDIKKTVENQKQTIDHLEKLRRQEASANQEKDKKIAQLQAKKQHLQVPDDRIPEKKHRSSSCQGNITNTPPAIEIGGIYTNYPIGPFRNSRHQQEKGGKYPENKDMEH